MSSQANFRCSLNEKARLVMRVETDKALKTPPGSCHREISPLIYAQMQDAKFFSPHN